MALPLQYRNDDGDIYCEQCAPAEVEGDMSYGETDVPENCYRCGRPCNYALTGDGVDYVIDHILDELDAWDGSATAEPVRDSPAYYVGSPSCAVVYDWATDLVWYNLDRRDQFILDHFLALASPLCTAGKRKKKPAGKGKRRSGG